VFSHISENARKKKINPNDQKCAFDVWNKCSRIDCQNWHMSDDVRWQEPERPEHSPALRSLERQAQNNDNILQEIRNSICAIQQNIDKTQEPAQKDTLRSNRNSEYSTYDNFRIDFVL
jgi:hypothetical protein